MYSNGTEILIESNDIIQNYMDDSSLFINFINISQLVNMSLDNTSEHIRRRQYEDAVSGVAIRDPLSIVIPITVFYSIIFFAGILGNVITCTVISRNKSMHTATNYYLFNLAISDLMLLISGMPPDIYTIWFPMSYPFNQSVCILQGLLSETSANATVLTITSFTVERYIAICHPFRQHAMSKLSRAIKFIMVIWCVAFCLAGPQAFQFGIVEDHGGKMCTVKNNFIEHAFEVSSFVFFVGPMTVICVLYVLIGVKLRKSKLLQGVKRKGCDFGRGISGQTRVIRMLMAVAFFLCWCPFHVQRLMAVYGSAATPSIMFHRIYTIMTYVSGVLYFLSTCINPLLYNIMSHKFRDAFKSTLARQCGFGKEYQNNHTYSALSRYGGSLRLTNAAAMNNRSSPANTNNNNNNGLQVGTTMMTTTAGTLGTNDNNIVGDKRDSEITLIPVSNGNTIRNSPYVTRCISVSSQGTVVTSISRNDVFTDDASSIENRQYKRPSDSNSKSTYKFPPVKDNENDGDDSELPQLNSTTGKSTGGALSTIAEKLRRGTKKVLQFKTTTPQSLANLQNPKLEEKVNSVDSLHTNTISNSSLQELDEDEFTSTELAKYMAEVNNEIR